MSLNSTDCNLITKKCKQYSLEIQGTYWISMYEIHVYWTHIQNGCCHVKTYIQLTKTLLNFPGCHLSLADLNYLCFIKKRTTLTHNPV